MRASQQFLALLILLTTTFASAQSEEELPTLELLGFIADFSDADGWVDPQNLEGLLSRNNGKEKKSVEDKSDEYSN
jgi:hypothetical protein